MLRLGFLASHRGSNMQAVVDACASGSIRAQPAVVISNNRSARALRRAESAGFSGYCLNTDTCPDPAELDRAMLGILRRHEVDLVVLTGYLKRVGPETLAAFRGRMINIHPSLLPRYGGRGMYGLRVHEAVLASGDKTTGVTIHHLEEEYDQGAMLAQRTVPVEPGDTPESLAARVLAVEHELLVETVGSIAMENELGRKTNAVENERRGERA